MTKQTPKEDYRMDGFIDGVDILLIIFAVILFLGSFSKKSAEPYDSKSVMEYGSQMTNAKTLVEFNQVKDTIRKEMETNQTNTATKEAVEDMIKFNEHHFATKAKYYGN